MAPKQTNYLGVYRPANLPPELAAKIRAIETEINHQTDEKNLLLMVFEPEQKA